MDSWLVRPMHGDYIIFLVRVFCVVEEMFRIAYYPTVGGFWWFWRRFLGIAIFLGDEIMVTFYPFIQVVQLLSGYTNYRL
jgi:hypothetical protein